MFPKKSEVLAKHSAATQAATAAQLAEEAREHEALAAKLRADIVAALDAGPTARIDLGPKPPRAIKTVMKELQDQGWDPYMTAPVIERGETSFHLYVE